MEETKKLFSPSDAMLHFRRHYLKGMFKLENGVKAPKEYMRIMSAVRAARAGTLTPDRCRAILETFAPGKYIFTTTIEAVNENAPTSDFSKGGAA